MIPPYFLSKISKYVLPNMQKNEILQTALIIGGFLRNLKIPPESALLSFAYAVYYIPT